VTIVLDDHLLRDWMTSRDVPLGKAIAGEEVASTNLWYVRLCKSAARATGVDTRRLNSTERRALVAGLIALPGDIVVVPMRDLAWRMGELAADHTGLSALGAEAVAAAIHLEARILVSATDNGPGIRGCRARVGIAHDALPR
jgi:hypothetical protein